MKTQKTILRTSLLFLTVILFTAGSNVYAQQDLRATLFHQADEIMKVAKESHADYLAPRAYGKAMEHYKKADEDFKKGKNIEEIRKQLRAAVAHMQKAIEATKLANVTLSAAISARAGAQNAEAPKFAAKSWGEAEKKFSEAASTLEEGDVKDAKKKAAEAHQLYRKAELEAIKANYLSETWTLLELAEKQDVKDYAPKTLSQAKQLVKQAEKELNENRYDTDVARNLAQQAKYEAKHSLYLTKTIKTIKDSKKSWEDLILEWEKPLQMIASSMDERARFDNGYGETTDKILSNINQYQDEIRTLSQDLADRNRQINLQQERIAELEESLGGVEQEKSELAQRMEEQQRIREKFASVEKMFTRDQAVVLREANDIILRMVGLSFPVGKSVIEPQYFPILTKVQQAINTFPQASITIEGHTDSYGSDETNMKLSQERAEAVRQYILANMGLEESRISAVGYGESSPIASNETPEGRSKNRRIDVIIHPGAMGTF